MGGGGRRDYFEFFKKIDIVVSTMSILVCFSLSKIRSFIGMGKTEMRQGVSLELSDREKFCDIFWTLGRSFGPNFGFPYLFYTFSLLPQLKIGRSQPA